MTIGSITPPQAFSYDAEQRWEMGRMILVSAPPSQGPWHEYPAPSWVHEVNRQLEELRRLRPGWSGERSDPPSPQVLESAVNVLMRTMAADSLAPALIPLVGGGLQMEWEANDVELHILVEPDGAVTTWCREGLREDESDRLSPSKIAKELSRLTTSLTE